MYFQIGVLVKMQRLPANIDLSEYQPFVDGCVAAMFMPQVDGSP
jgi:hypothetical protein